MNLFRTDSININGPFPTPDNCKKSCRGGAGAPPSACKIKAEDCPPLMGSSPLMGWSPYVKFMVISSQDNRKVAAKSRFKIQRELVKILGALHGVTKQRSSDLMVEPRSKEQERKLENVISFLDIPVTVGPHRSLNTSRGVIKHSDFQDCTDGEFVDEFPDVIYARRIHVRKGDVRIPINTIVLTFDCPKPPTSLRAGYLTVPVRDLTFLFRCAVLNATSLAMARTSAGDPTLYAVDAARSMLISTSAQLLPTASIAKAIIPPLASSVRSSWKKKPF